MTDKMLPEDVALFRADPDYAATLGIVVRCQRCGGRIQEAWGPWDGQPMVHAVKTACTPTDTPTGGSGR